MFTDVFFTPILMNDLAAAIFDLLARGSTGLFHIAGGTRLSKYDFALQMVRVFGCSTARIRPISVEAAALRARRPKDMSLSSAKAEATLGRRMPTASAGLQRVKELRASGWPVLLQHAVDSGWS